MPHWYGCLTCSGSNGHNPIDCNYCTVKLGKRNFLVTLKLFLNAETSLSLWSKWQIGHKKWFLDNNLFLIKPFLIAKFDCTWTFTANLAFKKGGKSKMEACYSKIILQHEFWDEYILNRFQSIRQVPESWLLIYWQVIEVQVLCLPKIVFQSYSF